jgi:hypothetical protein
MACDLLAHGMDLRMMRWTTAAPSWRPCRLVGTANAAAVEPTDGPIREYRN